MLGGPKAGGNPSHAPSAAINAPADALWTLGESATHCATVCEPSSPLASATMQGRSCFPAASATFRVLLLMALMQRAVSGAVVCADAAVASAIVSAAAIAARPVPPRAEEFACTREGVLAARSMGPPAFGDASATRFVGDRPAIRNHANPGFCGGSGVTMRTLPP
jgi:hypothetical protein